ncbi:class E sortase [Cellulosimicrobium arenosum]|uniref:Class E sortase n=1 Tax=Cellulosimicrobium arenosum TaxID=2708133 RepID=A0A927PFL6_9MICO|nr:class E sortase [Cellulosimicrobium arenosum]MBD8079999.1 class E sortase [Cellulosimicrobium arenosum]
MPTVRHRAPSGRRGGGASAVVGVLGEILITLGVLLGLYVVWQLWWTDVQADRVQAQTLQELDAPTPDAADVAVQVRRDDPPVMEPPAAGEVFGTLQVPRWDDAVMPIAEGTDKREVLDKAEAGHYPETVMPGDVGNFALAGHRMTYGAIFHRVEELEPDDPLVVQAGDVWYVYRVTDMRAVQPSQVEAVAPVPWEPGVEPTERLLTLTTCHPIGLNSLQQRFIVNARLDYWLPVADGTPPDLVGQTAPPADEEAS